MTEPIHIPGLKSSGKVGPNKITVYVAVPFNQETAVILNWKEEGEILDQETRALGSFDAVDYGLEGPDGKGVWVFDGELSVTFGSGGDPMEPPDYDHCLYWDGEWRVPSSEENARWAAFKPVQVTNDYEGKGSPRAAQLRNEK